MYCQYVCDYGLSCLGLRYPCLGLRYPCLLYDLEGGKEPGTDNNHLRGILFNQSAHTPPRHFVAALPLSLRSAGGWFWN